VLSPQEQRWYVAYTYPRHEKSVADQLAKKSVECFLPTISKNSRWKDRNVTTEVPLFPGYVFTRIAQNERLQVVSISGIVRMLSFNEVPVSVCDDEIQAIRICVTRGAKLTAHHFIAIGERVRVKEGIFQGVEGFVSRHHSGCSLVVTVALIQQAAALEIEESYLERVGPAPNLTSSVSAFARHHLK
jgi:transcription antitermination factor NusG